MNPVLLRYVTLLIWCTADYVRDNDWYKEIGLLCIGVKEKFECKIPVSFQLKTSRRSMFLFRRAWEWEKQIPSAGFSSKIPRCKFITSAAEINLR